MCFFGQLGDAFLGHYLELDFARRSINVWSKTAQGPFYFQVSCSLLQWPRYSSRERSEAISEYRVPAPLLGAAAETTCAAAAASSQAAAAGAGDAHAASHIRSATFGKQLQYLLQKQQPTNIHEQSLHSSVQLSLLFSSPTMTTYTNATSVCPRLYATRTYRRRHSDCHIHVRTYIVATRQVSTAVIR